MMLNGLAKQFYFVCFGIALVMVPPLHALETKVLPDSENCQIIVNVKGESLAVFEHQVRQLTHHFADTNIELLDLNNSRTERPYIYLSGRKRRQIKQAFTLVDNKSTAIVMYQKTNLFQVSGGVDLTLLLQVCQKHLNSKP